MREERRESIRRLTVLISGPHSQLNSERRRSSLPGSFAAFVPRYLFIFMILVHLKDSVTTVYRS